MTAAKDAEREAVAAELVFFGTAMAGVSHEVKNVLSIINESAGLLGDLAAAAERGKPLDPARLQQLSRNIGRNVTRGVAIINRMNRLAHSVDEPVSGIDLTQLTTDALELAQRRLSGAELQVSLPEGPIPLQGCAFTLHHLLGRALLLICQAGGKGPLKVSLAATAAGAQLSIARGPLSPSPLQLAELDALRPLAAASGVALHPDLAAGELRLLVPKNPGPLRRP